MIYTSSGQGIVDSPLLAERLKDVYRRMAHAAMRAGRDPGSVRLIVVTKTVSPPLMIEAVENGVRDLGENRVQEAEQKIPVCTAATAGSRLVWHFIGHLQKNKAKAAVRLFDLIHSVDTAGLADEIDRQAGMNGRVQRVMIQVKLSSEETKHGVAADALVRLLDHASALRNLSVEGLMTMPPFFQRPEEARPYFRRLRELRDEASARGFRVPELSMGMSNDFEIAVEEGATMVRIGTAVFGERSA